MEEGKRRRRQNACDACRRRKVRCDGAGDTCSNCSSLQIECTHTLEKKKRGPKGPFTKRTTTQRSLVNSVLSPSFVPPSDPDVVHKMLIDLARFARYLDRQLSLLRSDVHDLELESTSADPNTSPTPRTPDDNDAEDNQHEMDTLTSSLKSLIITSNRHLGKSSYLMFLQSAMQRLGADRDDEYLKRVFTSRQRPEYWAVQPWQRILTTTQDHQLLIFPPQPLLQTLIDTYFIIINTLFPLLHRQKFEHAIAGNLHLYHRPFGYIVLGVCAVASRSVNDPGVLVSESWYSAGWRFFSQIPIVKGNLMDQPTVEDVQICVLSTLFLQPTSTPDAVWTIVGLGIRYCQEIGVSSSHRATPAPHEEQQLLRAYWVLTMMDTFMGVILGRPSEGDVPLQEPEELEGEGEEERVNLAFFQTYCKLVKIVRRAQGLYTPKSKSKPKPSLDFVIELDSALNQFTNDIPLHLQYTHARTSENYTFFWQATILKAMVHWMEIHVHRVVVSSSSSSLNTDTDTSASTSNNTDSTNPNSNPATKNPDTNDTHKTILLSAARSIVHILETLHDRTEKEGKQRCLDGVPSVLPTFGAAVLVFLLSPSEKGYVERCLALMRWYEERYQMAGRIVDLLSAIITVHQSPPGVEYGYGHETQDVQPWYSFGEFEFGLGLPEDTTGGGVDWDAFMAGLDMGGLSSGVPEQGTWF